MSDDTIPAVAKATEAVSETSTKLIEAATSLGRVVKGPIRIAPVIVSSREPS